MAVDSSGAVYLQDISQNIYRYTNEGDSYTIISTKPFWWFTMGNDLLYVVDQSSISKYAGNGTLISSFAPPGQKWSPDAIAYGGQHLYVSVGSALWQLDSNTGSLIYRYDQQSVGVSYQQGVAISVNEDESVLVVGATRSSNSYALMVYRWAHQPAEINAESWKGDV